MKLAAIVAVDAVFFAVTILDRVTNIAAAVAIIGSGLITLGWALRKVVKIGRQWARVVFVLLGDERSPGLDERLARGEAHFAATDAAVTELKEDVARIDARFELIADAERAHIRAALSQAERRQPPSAA